MSGLIVVFGLEMLLSSLTCSICFKTGTMVHLLSRLNAKMGTWRIVIKHLLPPIMLLELFHFDILTFSTWLSETEARTVKNTFKKWYFVGQYKDYIIIRIIQANINAISQLIYLG